MKLALAAVLAASVHAVAAAAPADRKGTPQERHSGNRPHTDFDPKLDAEVRAKLDATVAAMQAMKTRAETVETYDQMIAEGNKEGNAVVQAAIDSLVAQTRSLERVIALLDLGKVAIEGSDSLDKPDAVFK